MKFSWDKIKKAVMCVLFLSIAGNLFLKTTYLFRNTGIERKNIIGMKQEGPLDMVYVGGSATFVYWQALRAWNDYGFTSYSYAVNSIQAEHIKYFIKETLKTHNPKVFVIDLRTFSYWSPQVLEYMEAGFRNGADSMDLSLNRFQMVRYFLDNRILDGLDDKVSYYFDIAKYHTNIDALRTPENWNYINNESENSDKGWQWIIAHDYLERSDDFSTEERAALEEGCTEILQELLRFCREEKLQVLFAVSPYKTGKEHQRMYNTMKDMIEKSGFQYLNANEYYDEMNLDFAKDFYNNSHVNCFGAEKYTRFLERYLVEQYNLPNRKDEELSSKWNENYLRFTQEEEETKQAINELIFAKEKAKEIGIKLKNIDDVYKWSILINNTNFIVFTVSQGNLTAPSAESRELLRDIGIDLPIEQTAMETYICVKNGDKYIYKNQADKMQKYANSLNVNGQPIDFSCGAAIDEKSHILIGNENVGRQQDGFNIVIYNPNIRSVIDSVTLKSNGRGELELHRDD